MPSIQEIVVETVDSDSSDEGVALETVAEEPNNLNESAFLPNMEPDHAGARVQNGDDDEFQLHTFPPSSDSESDGDEEAPSKKSVLDNVLSDPDDDEEGELSEVEKVRASKRAKRVKDSKRKMDYQNWLRDGNSSSKSDSDKEAPKDYWSLHTASTNTASKQKPRFKTSNTANTAVKSTPQSSGKKPAPKPALTIKSKVETLGLEVKNNGTLVKNHVSRKFKEFTKIQKNQQSEILGILKTQQENHQILMDSILNVKNKVDQVLSIVEKCPHGDKKPSKKIPPVPVPPHNYGRGSGGPENFRRREPDPNQHLASSVNRNGSIGNRNYQGNVTSSPQVTVNNNPIYHHHSTGPVNVEVCTPGYGVQPGGGSRKRRLSAMSMALIAEKKKQAHLRRHHLELERRRSLNQCPGDAMQGPPKDPYFGENLEF
ncbi:hypothetical protein SEMRO_746_G196350.1 [Seminavis robusta]|uniref:Uncharacterized protein n=1 Tax=Seminavis robusta TaxID=568900 RepID=A0A9N8HMH6_9STRA|nr:hypothetical protein SEMRO_746_G196350.1 [Seminavis robusta]|eukprot:Sro746_g196350.1 n/a (428) ;mRNA; f:7034-8317